MPTFPYYSSVNSYIEPYSSAKDGGELVTEFNQRAQLNVIGWKEVDISKDLDLELDKAVNKSDFKPGTYKSWMSGTKTFDDLKLRFETTASGFEDQSNLVISGGEALVCAYYGEYTEIKIPTPNILVAKDLPSNMDDDSYYALAVKLAIITTQSENNRHDERLVPPTGDVYNGVQIVIDRELPELTQLLLGILKCYPDGHYEIWNNPYKTRLISIEHISGAENYDNLVEVPDDEGNIYGIQKNDHGNLININEWTWLAYHSNLGTFLRNLALCPDDAGKPGGIIGGNVPLLPIIVGKAGEKGLPYSDYESDAQIIELRERNNNQPKPYLEYRVLKDGNKKSDCYSMQQVNLPFARYNGHRDPETVLGPVKNLIMDGYSGIISPESLWQLDQLWMDRDSLSVGTQWGPFESTDLAELRLKAIFNPSGIVSDPYGPFHKNDYYWVLNDTTELFVDPKNTHDSEGNLLINNFGTVSGQYTAITTGEVSSNVSGDITGSAPLDAEFEGTVEGKVVLKDSDGNPQEEEIQDGSVTGTLVSNENLSVAASGTLVGNATGTGSGRFTGTVDTFTQNVSARYVYMHKRSTEIGKEGCLLYYRVTSDGKVDLSKKPVADLTHSFMKDPTQSVKSIADLIAILKNPVANDRNLVNDVDTIVEAWGEELRKSRIEKAKANLAPGTEWTQEQENPINEQVDNEIEELKNDLKAACYEKDGDTVCFPVYDWTKQAIMRGFATPATPQFYGFVKPSDGSKFGDVIVDPTSNQLRLSDTDIASLDAIRWRYSTDTIVNLTSDMAMSNSPDTIDNTWYLEPVTIKLKGDGWDVNQNIITRLRGNITLDISDAIASASEDNTYLPLLEIKDGETITIVTNDTKKQINVTNCTLTPDNFNNVYRWVSSRFTSGSNTACLDNPWMTIPDAFAVDYDNSLQVRFASVTRGEYGITGAELDIWVKREDWTTPISYQDVEMLSTKSLKFPPFYFKLDEAGNVIDRQDIPDTVNLKVSGTGGTHRIYDGQSSIPIQSGNWVSTIDWENGGKFSLNARLVTKTTDRLHGLYDIRFRGVVQFLPINDMVEGTPGSGIVDYNTVYQNEK